MGVSESEGYLILGSLQKGSYYLGYDTRAPYFRKLPNSLGNIIWGPCYLRFDAGSCGFIRGAMWSSVLQSALVGAYGDPVSREVTPSMLHNCSAVLSAVGGALGTSGRWN